MMTTCCIAIAVLEFSSNSRNSTTSLSNILEQFRSNVLDYSAYLTYEGQYTDPAGALYLQYILDLCSRTFYGYALTSTVLRVLLLIINVQIVKEMDVPVWTVLISIINNQSSDVMELIALDLMAMVMLLIMQSRFVLARILSYF